VHKHLPRHSLLKLTGGFVHMHPSRRSLYTPAPCTLKLCALLGLGTHCNLLPSSSKTGAYQGGLDICLRLSLNFYFVVIKLTKIAFRLSLHVFRQNKNRVRLQGRRHIVGPTLEAYDDMPLWPCILLTVVAIHLTHRCDHASYSPGVQAVCCITC
jgi:hypothetical protein